MWKVREMVDKATNLVMNYTETEAKVRDATNDDPWGPSGNQMQEVASYTFTYEQFPEVMGMLWKRMLQDSRSNWRRTYKSLLLLDYLLKNGSERVVTSAREHVYDLRTLENYSFVDENGEEMQNLIFCDMHQITCADDMADLYLIPALFIKYMCSALGRFPLPLSSLFPLGLSSPNLPAFPSFDLRILDMKKGLAV